MFSVVKALGQNSVPKMKSKHVGFTLKFHNDELSIRFFSRNVWDGACYVFFLSCLVATDKVPGMLVYVLVRELSGDPWTSM
ncbi:hypothetical protein LX82_03699 [Celeribacter halophilus]|uniref:Uncharacterized protein n=1 Tax=Celeribacter halophilus TaxID=576117 RepID=A0A1I3X9E2_9RHOB|nr:hypothetical protein LX82_03699 [Celeribacter halophilus]SFK15556.1 hypothetical protein SAMN04488138_1427 [Celeribacter halophilus]